MTDKKHRSAQGEPDDKQRQKRIEQLRRGERAYEKALKAAYENDAYWLKYLDGQDWEIVFGHGEETLEQTRDRRNKAAIKGAYRDARETRTEEEALAFVLAAVENVKDWDRHEADCIAEMERLEKERAERKARGEEDDDVFDDDIPF